MVLRGPYSAPLPAVPSASWGSCGLGEALSSLWASLSVFEVRGGVAATPGEHSSPASCLQVWSVWQCGPRWRACWRPAATC